MDLDVSLAVDNQASIEQLLDLVAGDMQQVNRLIVDRLQSHVPLIPALADHLIAGGGKRLRPLLTVAAAKLSGHFEGDLSESACKLATAVEFIHTATLLHDDVVDASHLRRGQVAAHIIWGGTASILVGDFLFSRAFELMVETGSLAALEVLSKASRIIAEGEVLQLTKSHDIELDEKTYLEIITAKTAVLFAAAAEAGAISASAKTLEVKALHDYGLSLGIAFQLMDDLLDYQGNDKALGKRTGDDFREGKITLPLLLAIKARPEEMPFWQRIVIDTSQKEDDFVKTKQMMQELGIFQEVLNQAKRHSLKAKQQLEIFPQGLWRKALEDLADFAVSRQS